MELGSYFLFLQEQIKDIIIIITVADSTLRVEMNALEEQANDAKARDLSYL